MFVTDGGAKQLTRDGTENASVALRCDWRGRFNLSNWRSV